MRELFPKGIGSQTCCEASVESAYDPLAPVAPVLPATPELPVLPEEPCRLSVNNQAPASQLNRRPSLQKYKNPATGCAHATEGPVEGQTPEMIFLPSAPVAPVEPVAPSAPEEPTAPVLPLAPDAP